MSRDGLRDPLGAARVVAGLAEELERLGAAPTMNEDLAAFAAVKRQVRDEAPSPFFDPAVNDSGSGRFFWMQLSDPKGAAIGLQAFRIDHVNSSLADWGPSYTIGLYMRRQEVLVPLHPSPPRGSISERINGRLVYHGELWIDRNVRNRRIVEVFGRLGMLISLLRWNPDAIWALASQGMATHGHLNRMGFTYLERGFFRWQWVSEGIDDVEWVAIAERQGLEQMVEEMLTTPQQSRQA
jgi:hypothetical protein